MYDKRQIAVQPGRGLGKIDKGNEREDQKRRCDHSEASKCQAEESVLNLTGNRKPLWILSSQWHI